MFKFTRTSKRVRSPDMTPLVDIVFQLLLFFMLTASFVKIEALDLNFADKADGAAPVPDGPGVVVHLKGTDVLLNNSAVAKEDLILEITKYVANNKDTAIHLATERGVTVQSLIEALDLLKKANFNNVVIDNATTVTTDMPLPEPVPLPDLQSTKNLPGNAGSFNFDDLEKSLSIEAPQLVK
jgi:biopolymer transport protein ExbD